MVLYLLEFGSLSLILGFEFEFFFQEREERRRGEEKRRREEKRREKKRRGIFLGLDGWMDGWMGEFGGERVSLWGAT